MLVHGNVEVERVLLTQGNSYRAKIDGMLGTEPAPSDRTLELPHALDVFVEASKFIKIFKSEKDAKRFEIFTR